MTWVDDKSSDELIATYQHHHFLLRILRAISPYNGFSPLEVIFETQGDYAPFSVFISCGLMFGSDCWDDREEITPSNIGILEQTRKDLIAIDAMYDFAELFVCRCRKRLPITGLDAYGPESRKLFEECVL